MLEFLLELDTKLFLFLNGMHAPTWDIIMYEVSEKVFWYPFYGVLILAMVWRYKWNAIATLLFIALLITLSDQLSVKAFKEVFERWRPTHNPQIKDLVHTVKGYRGGDFGFVSSHAANTFAMAFFTSKLFKNRYYSWGIFIWAAVVSYSRIYLGVHYPLDIIGGALLGIFLGYLIFLFYFWFGNRYLKKTFHG